MTTHITKQSPAVGLVLRNPGPLLIGGRPGFGKTSVRNRLVVRAVLTPRIEE